MKEQKFSKLMVLFMFLAFAAITTLSGCGLFDNNSGLTPDQDKKLSQIAQDAKSIRATSESTDMTVGDINAKIGQPDKEVPTVFDGLRGIKGDIKTACANCGKHPAPATKTPKKPKLKVAKAKGSVTAPPPGKKTASTPPVGKKVITSDEAANLWIEIQKGLAGEYIEKEGKKGNRKHICHGVRTLLRDEKKFKPQFSYDNWEGDGGVMYAKKAFCEKKINIVTQKTVRNITQGSCLNYVFDKMTGRPGECNPSLPKVMEGYTYLTAGTYAAVRITPKGHIKREIAKFGDNKLGQDALFAKYHRNVIYTTPAGAPTNPTENPPPSQIGTGHIGPGGHPSENNSDIIGNSGVPFSQVGENIPGIGQAANYPNTQPMPPGKGAGEDKSNTYRSDYVHYSSPKGAKAYSKPGGN